jgi:CheY-like chemotaxis protein
MEGRMFTSEQIWKAVDALAREHGLSASRLSIMAGLDPTALNKSKRIGSDGRPRWMSTETVAKILSVTNTSFVEFVRMVDEVGADATAHAALHAGARWTANKPRILVVDQDEAFAAHAVACLAEAGYDTALMPDFRRALELIEGAQPLDMLIINSALPFGVRGAALARIGMMRRPELNILLLSGGEPPEPTEQEIGPMLRKPLEDSRLISEAARLLHS